MLSAPSNATRATSIAVDSQENVYVGGRSQVSNNYFPIFAKYNSSGTLQWQRYFDCSASGNDYGTSVEIDSNDNLHISVYKASATSGSVVAKLPSDGSLTGTYGSFTYGVLTYTDSTPSVTSASGSLAGADYPGTAGSPNHSATTTSLTSSTTTI